MGGHGTIGVALAVVLAVGLGGCGSSSPEAVPHPASSSASSAPMTSQQLSGRLVSTTDLPSGWTAVGLDVSDISATTSEQHTSMPPVPRCADMSSPYSFVTSVTADPIGSASAILAADAGSLTPAGTVDRLGLRASEHLFSLPRDVAHLAMQQIRDLVARCPTYVTGASGASSLSEPSVTASLPDIGAITTNYSLAAGPPGCDESLVVQGESSFSGLPERKIAANTEVVRCGSTLLVLNLVDTSVGNAEVFTAIAPVVVRTFLAG